MKSLPNMLTAGMAIVCLSCTTAAQSTAEASAPKPQDAIPDTRITQAVNDAMRRDHGVAAHLVDVETDTGIVTLTGQVDNLLAEDRAVAIAESIKGVRAVVNRIEVDLPKTVTDAELGQRVRDALLLDPATDSYEVNVIVDDGTVRLEGKVESWAERNLAGDVVRGVAGVRNVVNELDVNYVERVDSEIAQDIRRRLENDVWIDAGAIVVAVEDGVVNLTGSVGSAAEKSRAASRAWINGVKNVDDSGLKVRWWARDEMQRKQPVATMSDDAIEQAVTDALIFDPRVYSFQPEVAVDDGVVTLTGTVDNLRAKNAAGDDAHNTVGVWQVRNYIRVRTPDPVSDEEIRKRVDTALTGSPYVERHEIDPVVINQKVFLYGTVDSDFERRHAGLAAASVNGVVEVENRLDVFPDYFTFDERQLRQEIEDELWWSPFVDSDQVEVTVENDTAILTGTVDTWREWTKASENAREGGARHVINRLDVAEEGEAR